MFFDVFSGERERRLVQTLTSKKKNRKKKLRKKNQQIEKLGVDILERRLVQAAVAADSPIVGRSVREAGFRARYDAVVVGISRAGVSLPPDVRDVRLKPGDVLLLDAGRGFARAHANDRAFTLINDVPKSSPIKVGKMWLAIFLLLAMISTQIVGEFFLFVYVFVWIFLFCFLGGERRKEREKERKGKKNSATDVFFSFCHRRVFFSIFSVAPPHPRLSSFRSISLNAHFSPPPPLPPPPKQHQKKKHSTTGGVLSSKKIIDQELISLFPAAILTAGLMLLFRCLTADQARKAIMIDVYVCIAFAFAVSSAMEVSN